MASKETGGADGTVRTGGAVSAAAALPTGAMSRSGRRPFQRQVAQQRHAVSGLSIRMQLQVSRDVPDLAGSHVLAGGKNRVANSGAATW